MSLAAELRVAQAKMEQAPARHHMGDRQTYEDVIMQFIYILAHQYIPNSACFRSVYSLQHHRQQSNKYLPHIAAWSSVR